MSQNEDHQEKSKRSNKRPKSFIPQIRRINFGFNAMQGSSRSTNEDGRTGRSKHNFFHDFPQTHIPMPNPLAGTKESRRRECCNRECCPCYEKTISGIEWVTFSHGVYENHKFTAEEKEILGQYEALNYLEPITEVYKQKGEKRSGNRHWDRWYMMFFVGLCIGFMGFLLRQLIDVISELRFKLAEKMLTDSLEKTLGVLFGVGAAFVFIGTCLVVYVRPSAASSGMPQLIGFLNGVHLQHIFDWKTLVIKFFSCICAIGGGLPAGPEAPMVHMGSLVGASVTRCGRTIFGINLRFMDRFRSSKDRRIFISAGAAAGISSAFGAPIGGLLFSMEEVSSYWDMKLTWQTFFCCMISGFTTSFFASAFHGFRLVGKLGNFNASEFVITKRLHTRAKLTTHITEIIPCIVFGILGGVTGALWVHLNAGMEKLRFKIFNAIKRNFYIRIFQCVEPIVILFIMVLLTVYVPASAQCTVVRCNISEENPTDMCADNNKHVLDRIPKFRCPKTVHYKTAGQMMMKIEYNQAAAVFFSTPEKALADLFSRDTHDLYDYNSLILMFIVLYFMAAWTSRAEISSGVFVPMLMIGGLYGRFFGKLAMEIARENGYQEIQQFSDAGTFAMLGATSFLAGVTRLTLSLTVLMVELTNDVQALLLVMTTTVISKLIGDLLSHPLYHHMLGLKCIPYLKDEPSVLIDGKNVNLKVFSAAHVMSRPVHTLLVVEEVKAIVNVLIETTHGGFPVVSEGEKKHFLGLITRAELIVLLVKFLEDLRRAEGKGEEFPNVYEPKVEFNEIFAMINSRIKRPDAVRKKIVNLRIAPDEEQRRRIDLARYINTSAPSVNIKFCLKLTYIVFRSLGLRHLVVVDDENVVQGMITRKDLMSSAIAEKILPEIRRTHPEIRCLKKASQFKDYVQKCTCCEQKSEEDRATVATEEPKRPANELIKDIQRERRSLTTVMNTNGSERGSATENDPNKPNGSTKDPET